MSFYSDQQIIATFNKYLDKRVAAIKQPDSGQSSFAREVVCADGSVFYFKQGFGNYELQYKLYPFLKAEGVLLPKITAYSKSWIIQEALPGIKLDYNNRTLTNKILMFFGCQLGLIHQNKTEFYGNLKEINKGCFKNYHEFYKKTLSLIPKKYRPIVNEYINKRHDTRLNHGDVFTSHMYIKEEKYIGIIDWDDIVSAPREYDLSELMNGLDWDIEYWESLMKGYTKYFDYIDINKKDLIIAGLLQVYDSYRWYIEDKKQKPDQLMWQLKKIKYLEDKIDKW